jgi:hypothetical protein
MAADDSFEVCNPSTTADVTDVGNKIFLSKTIIASGWLVFSQLLAPKQTTFGVEDSHAGF